MRISQEEAGLHGDFERIFCAVFYLQILPIKNKKTEPFKVRFVYAENGT